jgi:hypothetical protein
VKYALLATVTATAVAIVSATVLGCFLIGGTEWRLTVGADLLPAIRRISWNAVVMVPVGCLAALPMLHLGAKLSRGWKPKQSRWLGALWGLGCAYAWGALQYGGFWLPQLRDTRVQVLGLTAMIVWASFAFNYATLVQNKLRQRTRKDLF